jgi:hypothetical protein
MSTWNFRVMVEEQPGLELVFGIYEVYYDGYHKPVSYSVYPYVVNELNKREIKWVLKKMKLALKKPVLWHGSKFPKEYKPKNK